MREVAIINFSKNVDLNERIINKLHDKVTVFCHVNLKKLSIDNVNYVVIPSEIADHNAKIRNYIMDYYFNNNFKGFLHILEDSVDIFNSPDIFISELETMMEKLNLKSWFNTVTDVCNYTFHKYNPRIAINIDDEESSKKYNKEIYWTSHANTSWVCYDYSKCDPTEIHFNDKFRIPMYYIIEFLARRRNTKKANELYYMNFYPTIAEEKNVFKLRDYETFIPTTSENDHKTEGDIFNGLNIDHSPNSVVEELLEDMYVTINR